MEGDRVREGQDRDFRPVARQNPGGNRYPDHRGAQWRTGRTIGAGEETADRIEIPQGGVITEKRATGAVSNRIWLLAFPCNHEVEMCAMTKKTPWNGRQCANQDSIT